MSDIFHVLADHTRREILVALLEAKEAQAGGEMRVSDLVEALGQSQPTVSKHLKTLRDAGVVTVREEGVSRYYAIDVEPLHAVEDYVLQFLTTDIDTEISVEYLAEHTQATEPVLPEQLSQAAAEVGRAAALATKPVKELVARFKLKG